MEAESRKIINQLLVDSIAKADFNFYNIVLTSSYAIQDDYASLLKAYQLIRHKPEYRRRTAEIAGDIARVKLRDHQIDSALIFINGALPEAALSDDPELRSQIYRTATEIYYQAGMPDSAMYFLGLYLPALNSVAEFKGTNEIVSAENRSEIMKYETMVNNRRTMEHLIFWIAILGLVVIAMAVVILLMRRSHRNKLAMARVQLDLERDRRSLVSSTLAITEKDNLLHSILGEVKRLEKEEKIPASESRHLDSIIRLHLASQADWNSVVTQFEKVHPLFVKSLKERYPRISEGDIRLAVYIKVGMQTKQIAKMLNVLPDSIKKNRHRLRERLGIRPDESLEDLLRNL